MQQSAILRAAVFIGDIPTESLSVVNVEIVEQISSEQRCVVDVLCAGPLLLDPHSLLGMPAGVVLATDAGVLRRFGGLVARVVESVASADTVHRVRFELISPLGALKHSSDYRIFQQMTSSEIVSQLASSAGLSGEAIEFRLEGALVKRVSCTQAGESVREFVDRVLEEEGICWFVEHRDDGAKVVFTNGTSGFSSTETEVVYRDRFGMQKPDEQVAYQVTARAAVRPQKVVLRDHDFSKPALDLEATAEEPAPLARQHYEYPGWYTDPAHGRARAATVLASHVASASSVRLTGAALSVTVGHELKLSGTPDGRLDGAYVPTMVRHVWQTSKDGRVSEISTTADLLHKGIRFAPSPSRPRRQSRGQTAIVTVPAGEEIHCDKHGRINVQFHWDRVGRQDEKSSAMVRVAQMHTSGSVAVPRKDWEVFLECEDGDLDRPVVIGRLYNAAIRPVDSLPGGKSNSSLASFSSPGGGGHNEIRMNDGAGSELFQVHAQKDMSVSVANDKKEKVATTATVSVAVNHTLKVGGSQAEKVGDADQLKIGGSQVHKVGASRTKTVGGDEKSDVTGSRSVTIGANHTTLTPMSDSTSTSGSLSETVGGMCLEAAALGVGVAVAGSTSISVGAAKIEAVATGKTDMTVGARASTIGGAFINVTPADVTVNTKGVKVTTVGGAWLANAGGDAEISSGGDISITVGGAVLLTGASVTLSVGSSSVSISGGSITFDSPDIKMTASGPAGELAAGVGSK